METIRKFVIRGDFLLVLAAIVAALFVALGIHYQFNRGDWATWVQAVGSIAALAVAIFIMSKQSRAAVELMVKSDQTALLRRAWAVHVLIENCHRSVYAAMTQLEKNLEERVDHANILAVSTPWSEMLGEARAALNAVPVHELGSSELVIATISTLEDLLFLNNTLQDWRDGGVQHFSPALAKKVATRYKAQATANYSRFEAGCKKLADS